MKKILLLTILSLFLIGNLFSQPKDATTQKTNLVENTSSQLSDQPTRKTPLEEPYNWLTLLAIILGPILAVQIQKHLEKSRDEKQRKLYIFKTLITTRRARLSWNHVQALNMIDLEYRGKSEKEKAVIAAWKIYNDHLQGFNHNDISELYAKGWNDKYDEYFNDLLFKMSIAQNYDFDMVTIKRSAYSPGAHGFQEDDELTIRKGMVKLFSGNYFLPVEIKDFTPPKKNSEGTKKEN